MSTKFETFIKSQLKQNLPEIRPGDTVKIHQKISASAGSTSVAKATLASPEPSAESGSAKEAAMAGKKEGYKERLQTFEGIVIARKHGREAGATITVRREISGIGVERVFPIHSPSIENIEILKRGKPRRAKLYYLRKAKGKKAKLKER